MGNEQVRKSSGKKRQDRSRGRCSRPGICHIIGGSSTCVATGPRTLPHVIKVIRNAGRGNGVKTVFVYRKYCICIGAERVQGPYFFAEDQERDPDPISKKSLIFMSK